MASGNTLVTFHPRQNEYVGTNCATPDTRNGQPVLDFDDTTAKTAIFSDILPRSYAGGGITAYLHVAATSAITGTFGFTIEFERIGSSQDIDSDSFASAQTFTATTVPGTSGRPMILSLAISDGANIDSLAAGEKFRIRIKRDVANDNAAGDAELIGVELKET